MVADKRTRWSKFVDLFFIVSAVNLLAFIGVGIFLGGIAIENPSNDGKYYLAQGESLTAVSLETYRYSQYHMLSVLVTIPVAVLLFFSAGRDTSK